MAKNQLHLEILTNDINGKILGNEDLKQQIINLRKQKNIAIAQREAIKQSNIEKQQELDEINKKNEKAKGKIKTAELKRSVDTGKAQQKQFEDNRDELEEEYHKLIEEYIKREREEKKEQAKKRQMLSMVSDSKALFKGANAKELERQIKLLAAEEISDRTPIIEEVVNKCFASDKVKFRRTRDIVGVEICASVKNVMAIASGILEGMGVTDSTRALFLTESLNDIKELIHALGGKKKTILSFAGFGDILMTCTSHTSRNFSFGYIIGKGASNKEIDAYLEETTVEGMYPSPQSRCSRS